MTQNWVDVPNYEGRYQVSDTGEIRSLPRVRVRKNGHRLTLPGRAMKPTANESGHLRVNLEGKLHYVHRVVASAFLGDPPEGHEVRHLNGDPADNRAVNLRYGTRSENMYDKVRHGNHFQVQKTHCPRRHLLGGRNNTPAAARRGFRKCLACSRAQGYAKYHQLPASSIQELSDTYYRAIMEDSK